MNPKTKAVSDGAAKKKKKQTTAGKFVFTVAKILIIFFIAISCATVGIVGGAIYGYVKTAKPISDEDLKIKILTTFIYDDQGKEIDELTGKDNKDRELVYDKDIPQYLKDAFVAVEDERFYEHPGIDIRRIASAVWSFVLNAGSPKHGASTITQQVVKNVTGNERVTLQRKVQEQWAALQLERKLEKWQILELYMNVIYMGHNFYGVQSASKAYFGKPVNELSLAECALLAGITNSPGRNDPYNQYNKDGQKNAKARQEIILSLMLKQGKIDQQQYEQALKEEIKFEKPSESDKATKVQSYFVDQVISDVVTDLMSEWNMSRDEALRRIYNNGLKIYTTQNSEMQKAMDEVFTDEKYFEIDPAQAKKNIEHAQAAMVIIDPYTGQVKAIYGGYGEKKASNTLNRATKTKRQPGSSFKPIAVYGPAIDLGIVTPATVIDDAPVYMMTGKNSNKPYPRNYDYEGYDGLTTVRNAIKASVNVVAATVWRDLLGPDKSIEYLKKVNIDREKEKYVSLSLGGLNEGVNPLQMAAAYQPFVNKGMFYEPATYTKVVDSNDKVLLEKKPKYHPVYSEQAAFLMVNMMTEVVKPKNTTYPHSGTAASYGVIRNAQKQVIPTAGKTGTTSDNIDKWFVGYSPYYVGATWYGYDNKIKPIKISKTEYSNAQKIWQAVMLKVHANLEPKEFQVPAGLVKKRICIYSGKVATELCANDPRGNATIEEYFIKGTEPKDEDPCDVHVQATVCKDSQDIWKRNLLAGPYCPLGSQITRVFIQRKVPYVPKKPGDVYPKDWIYELPAGEYCNVHGVPAINPINTEQNPVTTTTPQPDAAAEQEAEYYRGIMQEED